MNEEQIKIGGELLKLFVENDGIQTENQYMSSLKNKFGDKIYTLALTTSISMIDDYKLIRRGKTQLRNKIITAEGRKANEIGLKKYIKEFEEKEELKIENLKANIISAKIAIKKSKHSLTVSIFALIAAIFAPVLATIIGFYIENHNSLKNSNKNNKNETKQDIIHCDTVKQNVFVPDSINIIPKPIHCLRV